MQRLWKVVGSLLLLLACSLASAIPIPGQGTWEATLKPRDLNGDGVSDAFFDTSLKITWADFNIGVSSWQPGYVITLFGVYGWRLSAAHDTGPHGCDFSYFGGTDCGYSVDPASSELAHLYYITLGNKALCAPGYTSCVQQPDSFPPNTGNFQSVPYNNVWTGGVTSNDPNMAYTFSFSGGVQQVAFYPIANGTWFVFDGDVAAVPELGSLPLLLLGLLTIRTLRSHRSKRLPKPN